MEMNELPSHPTLFGLSGSKGAAEGTMPYVGIATFLKLPFVSPAQAGDYDFLIVGVPYDEGTSNRPGARFGPRAVRNASTLYSYEGSAELFDVERGETILAGARIGDLGDVVIGPLEAEDNRRRMAEAAALILEAGAVPVGIGGDHSVTASLLTGFAAQNRRPYLVHLDTHMDYDSYLAPHAHGTPVRRSVEQGLVSGVTQAGIRGLNSGRADWEQARGQGVEVITAATWREQGPDPILSRVPAGEPVYLSIDVDVFDPSIAPGTGTPEPGGMDYPAVRKLVREISRQNPITGIDLVEVNPAYDHAETTAILAARVLLDTMAAAWDSRKAGAGGAGGRAQTV
ncbi:MAG: agmatinase [Thermoleophilia bacterium]